MSVDGVTPENWKDLVTRQAHLEAEVAKLGTGQEALLRAQSTMSENIQRIVERQSEPPPATNWVGIGSLVLAGMAVMGSLFVFALAPVKEDIARVQVLNDRQDQLLIDRAGQISQTATLADWYQKWLNWLESQADDKEKRLDEVGERVSRLEGLATDSAERVKILEDFAREAQFIHGQRAGLDRQVQGIDNFGSRRWNDANKEKPNE